MKTIEKSIVLSCSVLGQLMLLWLLFGCMVESIVMGMYGFAASFAAVSAFVLYLHIHLIWDIAVDDYCSCGLGEPYSMEG